VLGRKGSAISYAISPDGKIDLDLVRISGFGGALRSKDSSDLKGRVPRRVPNVSRLNRRAAMACLVVALLSQLLLPALHVLVHYRELHGHSHGARKAHGAKELAWVIERARGRALPAKHTAKAASPVHEHEHERARRSHQHQPGDEPEKPAPHHHDGDQPGAPHGASSLEHLTAFFLEATPPRLAIPFRRVELATVALVAGRRVAVVVRRAQPVRGPPQLS
jgi:hypothetical protein